MFNFVSLLIQKYKRQMTDYAQFVTCHLTFILQ